MDATQNVELQEVFKLAEAVDPHRERTIGVLTKSDRVEEEYVPNVCRSRS